MSALSRLLVVALPLLGLLGCSASPDGESAASAEAAFAFQAVPPGEGIPEVSAWLHDRIAPPSHYSAAHPLVVVIAAGTANRISVGDLRPWNANAPDTGGYPWLENDTSAFQAGHIAIAALWRAGYQPCDINSEAVRFVTWGYGDDTAGMDFYYRAPVDIGTDLLRVHSLGGANAAMNGPFNNMKVAYTAHSLENDARALYRAVSDYTAKLGGADVVLSAHSWGAGYANYMLDRFYADDDHPSFQIKAALTVASPSRVLSYPFAFGWSACPKYLDYDLDTTSCSVHECAEGPGARGMCDLGGHGKRSTPTYSFSRPDDPIASAGLETIYRGIQSGKNEYPGINGHDYLIRRNDSYAVAPSGEGERIAGGGKVRFRGIYGIDTLETSCAIGGSSNLFYAGSCEDASDQRSSLCDGDLVCLHGRDVQGDGSSLQAEEDTCFSRSAASVATEDARPLRGFLSCGGW